MSEAEVASFLAEERTVTCATTGPRGWPHLMPLWYVLRDLGEGDTGPDDTGEGKSGEGKSEPGESEPAGTVGEAGGVGSRLWAWTYAASQKVRNLERDPRATLQVEAGELYEELRGVMIESDVIVHRDIDTVGALGGEIFRRYASPRGEPPADVLPREVAAMVDKQAAKRVALEFVERRRASWDHRKLAGVY